MKNKQGEEETIEDCAYIMWSIICNVSNGDWTKQGKDWQRATKKVRDYYHRMLDKERIK